jgi:transaldolase
MRELEIYADGIEPTKEYISHVLTDFDVTGFTCNPSLVKQYLPIVYKDYCNSIIDNSNGYPVSIQVLTNDIKDIVFQALEISSWGHNVYVKIPIVNEKGESCAEVIKFLLDDGIKINVTAIFTPQQVRELLDLGVTKDYDVVLSVFSGRIADTGISPNTIIKKISDMIGTDRGNIKLLWAGVRSLGDIHLAKEYCDIITIPQPILEKLKMKDKNLRDYSIETVQMFANDAKNFTL